MRKNKSKFIASHLLSTRKEVVRLTVEEFVLMIRALLAQRTQAELGVSCGISQRHISNWASGALVKLPSYSVVLKIKELYDSLGD